MFEILVTQTLNPIAPPVIPAAPTSFTATADADSINLAWTRVGTYDKVLIDRKDTGEYAQIASINSAASYDDTTAVAGITYTYRVRGLRNGYPSPYSVTASATISAGPVAATGTYTVINYANASFTAANLTVDNVGLTEGLDWNAAVSNNATASSIALAINLNLGTVTASANGAVVTITAVTAGSAGNSIAFDKGTITNSGMTVSGSTLSGGSD